MNGDPLATNVLVVVTSADRLSDGTPTGLWLEEFERPFRIFRDQAYRVTVASPRGGLVPIDPRSQNGSSDDEARAALLDVTPLDAVDADDHDALFLAGGHGTMIDFPVDPRLRAIVETYAASDVPIAAVCHGVAALVEARGPVGAPLVAGVRLTGFTDAEERATGLEDAVPFLLETRLRERGAKFVAAEPWSDHIERHGAIVTGQNPQSSWSVARALVHEIQRRKVAAVGVRP
jgi:putative intracellular protease/amidase